MRITDDGGIPPDNPFVGQPGAGPEIYTYGNRNPQGLAMHPETGQIWESEHGPKGGDEINLLVPGTNYGWPVITYGRSYSGAQIGEGTSKAGMAQPVRYWGVPSISPSGLAFYTGEHFPAWQGNLFVGSMMVGRMFHTGHLERIVFNADGEEIRREWLLAEFKQRIRDVRQGPDGYLYILTEEDDAVLLRLEPA